MKSDKWNNYDVTLAAQILRQQGREVTPDAVRLLQRPRIADMARPEPSQKTWIFAGYLFALVGGFWARSSAGTCTITKNSQPDGTQVFAFSPQDRVQGFRIFVVGLFGLALTILLRALPNR